MYFSIHFISNSNKVSIMGGILESLERPGVEELINIALIFALVVVTAYYTRKVHQQTELMKKDRERASIIELVKRVIVPCLGNLEYTKEKLQNNKYYDLNQNGWFLETYSLISSGICFNTFLKRNPDFSELFKEYEGKREALQKRLDFLKDKITAIYTMEKIEEMFKEFNKNNPDKKIDFHESLYMHIIVRIINNDGDVGHDWTYWKFWNEYRPNLLEVKNEEEIRKILESIDESKTELLKVLTPLKNKFEEIRDKYLSDYSITVEEIGP